MKKIFLIKNRKGQRLDKFLIRLYPDFSRAHLQRQIKSGAVSVNGEIKKPSYILKEGDKIKGLIEPPEKISLEPDPSIKLNIIYEDGDVIVIDKPAGLTVHPGDSQKSGTLVNALISHYPPLAQVGESPIRPGIVHRLDKDTSGLMIIAKNNNTFEFLKNQFKNKLVEKKYLTLVVGRPKEPSGKIKTFITRSKSDPTKQKVIINPTPPPSKEGGWEGVMREAVTHYKTLREFADFTLLEAHPKTGRMHQIRAHFAWLGCPVAGDKKYGRKSAPKPTGLNRQFLHAAELKITLPNGQEKTFASSLAPELKTVLGALDRQ